MTDIITVDDVVLSESTDELRSLALTGTISSTIPNLKAYCPTKSTGQFATRCIELCTNLETFATNAELLFSNTVDGLSGITTAFREADRA